MTVLAKEGKSGKYINGCEWTFLGSVLGCLRGPKLLGYIF